MKKVESRVSLALRSAVVFFASLLFLIPTSTADEGIQGGGGEGRLSRFLGKLSNPFAGLPNIFSELSPADVGHKPRVKPHLNFSQGFNSNARIGENQADAAWQARLAPGITVSIPSGKLYTEADYTYGFAPTQGRKTNANVNTHNLSALARYDLTTDTLVGIGNNFQISEVPGEGGDQFMLETATAQVKHRLGPKLSATATDTFQWFNDKTESSRFSKGGGASTREKEFNNEFFDNGVGVSFNYDATTDLSVGPAFNWNIRNFEKATGKDYWQIQPGVNASYRLGPKTTVSGNFGWAYRKFDVTRNTTSGSHESELVWGATISHLYGRKLVWSVSYAKSLQDTFDTSFIFKDTPAAIALDNLDRDFRVIKSHRLGSSVNYNLTERNSMGVFGDFQFLSAADKNNIINGKKGDEKAMEVGGRYTYRFNRYITFDVVYIFGRRFTTEAQVINGRRNEYTFHKVTGGVNIAI